MMAGRAVRESVTRAGRAERARAARAFVSAVLGPAHPCGDVAVSLARPVAPQTLTRGLRQHGLEPRQARNTALAAWASDLPPAVLASLLGVHI